MTRPRLLVLASTFPAQAHDGTPGFVLDLAQQEAEAFETTVIVPSVPGATARQRIGEVQVIRFRYFPRRWEDLADGAILENLRARPSRWLQVVPFVVAEWLALRREVRRQSPDVLHVHWLVPQGVAALGAMRQVPSVVTTLGGDLYGLRDPVSTALKRLVVRRAAAVTAMNEDMRAQLVGLGAAPADAHVMPMGADLSTIRAEAAEVARVPGQVLFVGRLVEKKGLRHLLAALPLLADLDLRVRVVGDGPLRAELEASARGLPVTFLGALGRGELAREYAASALMVVPSTRAASGDQDGLPVALLEAMGVGTPIVASDLPGLNEVVLEGHTGLLVQAGDEPGLAAAVRSLVADPDRAERLGEAARELSESLSVDAVGRRYRDLLTSLVGAEGRGPGR
ncbi:glycosyltransferase [Dermatophilaceae bacterium Soc4.6]